MKSQKKDERLYYDQYGRWVIGLYSQPDKDLAGFIEKEKVEIKKDMNPRFVAWCEAVELDISTEEAKLSSSLTTAYINWISKKWSEWRKDHNRKPFDHLTDKDHADFDAWLEGR